MAVDLDAGHARVSQDLEQGLGRRALRDDIAQYDGRRFEFEEGAGPVVDGEQTAASLHDERAAVGVEGGRRSAAAGIGPRQRSIQQGAGRPPDCQQQNGPNGDQGDDQRIHKQ